MKRRYSNGWVNALFALVFIAVPAVVGMVFFSPDWNKEGKELANQPYWFYWVVAIGFVIYALIFSLILIKLEVLGMDCLTFNVPIALVFATLFVTYPWHTGAKWGLTVLMVIIAIATAWPMNTFVWFWAERQAEKIKENNRKTRH